MAKRRDASTMVTWKSIAKNPTFHDTKGMISEAMQFPKAETVDIFSPEFVKIPHRMMVRNADTKELYEVVSDDYQVVQDTEVIFPLVEAIDDIGVTPHGGFRDVSHGQLVGYLFFEEEITKAVLGDDHEQFNFGVSVHNSHNGKTSFGVAGMAWRLICTNGMFSKQILGGFSYDHLKGNNEDKKYLKDAIETMFKNIPHFEAAVQRISEIRISYADATELLTGLGFAERSVEDLIVHMSRYAPGFEVRKDVSVWALANAITFRASEATSSSTLFERETSKAESLMVVEDINPIIEKGREVIEIREARKKKKG